MSDSKSSWPYPKMIAHRGAGRLAPENTLASMRLGAAHGFSMMEYDVKLSRDGVPVLLHDDTVNRCSNGAGNAADQTYNELAKLDFGRWHSKAYAGEPIPTLYAIAAFTLANNILSNIEIKPHTGAEAETGTQVALIARQLWARAAVAPLLSSFSEIALESAMKAAPELPRALLIGGALPPDWLARTQRLKCVSLNLDDRHTTQEVVRAVHTADYKIAIWTVNDAARARELFNWGCDAIFTDAIDTLSPHF
ncbi:MAG: glycerophosphodiester phosphodiesterase [Candidimonas sp.]|nr:MAG: glycerophosphodiester phosphodiesterase [Candidimonas sp.]TAM24738.1 MAG: glycerophosphodiester phosphodiesterase [Candidimonas sp.]TAM80006.1 MAG: glycerophosphodiester phosphodiesterase [Candidimonas sp.]